jgi:hypothetical protein
MATRRKNYIRVARSVLGEPWPYEIRAACVMLQCHMANRWAIDALTAEEACTCALSWPDLFNVTGKLTRRSARQRLYTLAEHVSISIDEQPDYVTIKWPKLAEYQGWDARERAENGEDSGHTPGQSAPSPSPSPTTPSLSPQVGASAPASEHLIPQPDWVHIPSLLHTIKDLPGTPAEHQAWLIDNLGLMGLEVLKDSSLKTKANKAAAMGALAFRYRRADCAGTTPGGRKKPAEPTSLRSGYESSTERSQRAAEEYIEQHGGAK